jgi:hypothetical protein
MPIHNPTPTDNNNPNPPDQSKLLIFVLIGFLLLTLGLLSLRFFQLNKNTPIDKKELKELLEESGATTIGAGQAIQNLGEAGYYLNCQINYDEIFYPEEDLGNFIIHSAAPCWFINDNEQLQSVIVPIVIENVPEQKWGNIEKQLFTEIETPEKGRVFSKIACSQFPFINAESSEQLGTMVLDDAIIANLWFASQKAFNPYYGPHFINLKDGVGEFVDGSTELKAKDISERFLHQLASEQQNPQAIDYFVTNQEWDSDLNQYLFYYKSQTKSIE